jgi:hypothetical protein
MGSLIDGDNYNKRLFKMWARTGLLTGGRSLISKAETEDKTPRL